MNDIHGQITNILAYNTERKSTLVTSYNRGNGIEHTKLTAEGKLEVRYTITDRKLFNKNFIVPDEEKTSIKEKIRTLLGRSADISINGVGDKKEEYTYGNVGYKKHEVTITVTPEIFLEKFFESKSTAPTNSRVAPNANDFSLFANRKTEAQQRLAEIGISRRDEAPQIRDASVKKITRDLEMRLLGALSNGLMFVPTANEDSKHFPWQQNGGGTWAAELSTLDIDINGTYTPQLAKRIESQLHQKYSTKGLEVEATSTSLLVCISSEKGLHSFCEQLMRKAGLAHEPSTEKGVGERISSLSEKDEVIKIIDINLGVNGTNHDPYRDALVRVRANGRTEVIGRGTEVGEKLRDLIDAAHSSDKIHFDKTVKIILQIPSSIANANNLKPWHFPQRGVLGVPKLGTSGGDIEIQIYSKNIYQAADAIASAFKSTPQFGFGSLNESQGVQSWRELTGQTR